MQTFVVISGCSGGGKSTLLRALAERGYATVEEPGRRIVREELRCNGRALPWLDAAAFARRAIALALEDRRSMSRRDGWVFFDRSLIDAAAFLEQVSGEALLERLARRHRYHPRVFMAPPWRAIFKSDDERRHGFEAAEAEYRRLVEAYPSAGYEILELPREPLAERVAFVLSALGAGG